MKKFWLFVGSLCLPYLALATTNIDPNQQLRLDIERFLAPDKFQTILVGEEEKIVVLNEANIALTKGVAILVTESGRSSLNRFALASLVPYLNDFGWVTILTPAPTDGLQIPIKETTETDDSQPQESTGENTSTTTVNSPIEGPKPFVGNRTIYDESFEQHEQNMINLLNSVARLSGNYPGFFLVIAQGTSAAWLTKIYAELKLPMPDALVAISANWPDHHYNKDLPRLMGRTPIPVLDLYSQGDNLFTTRTAKDRRVASERSLKLHYRQREIAAQSHDPNQYEMIAKEIYGWLTYMGW